MANTPETLADRLRRGHLGVRLMGRALRELQAMVARAGFLLTRPQRGHGAVITLNADEENATVMAAKLRDEGCTRISFVTPNAAVSRSGVEAAARRLGLANNSTIEYLPLRFWPLLLAYLSAEVTYSTHVLLPGVDRSKRRIHVHFTHGIGPKRDRTFRGPATIVSSTEPRWDAAVLEDYRLPATTARLSGMPRLEVLWAAAQDAAAIKQRLGCAAGQQLVVWAPTYRSISRAGGEIRTSGVPLSATPFWEAHSAAVNALAEELCGTGAILVVKAHPLDADTLDGLGLYVVTNASLRGFGLSAYELFGAADGLISDYSSIASERRLLGLPVAEYVWDEAAFRSGHRGLR